MIIIYKYKQINIKSKQFENNIQFYFFNKQYLIFDFLIKTNK